MANGNGGEGDDEEELEAAKKDWVPMPINDGTRTMKSEFVSVCVARFEDAMPVVEAWEMIWRGCQSAGGNESEEEKKWRRNDIAQIPI